MELSGHLLSILIFFPAFGALALLFLRSDDEYWIRRLTFVVSVVEFLFSLILLRVVAIGAPGYALTEYKAWISSPPINYHLGVDGISMFLVILTTLLTPICVLASWKGVHHRIKEFHVMLLLLEVGIIGVFLALDLFVFFLFWEVMLIPMAFLIGIWGHERRIYAAVKFFIYTMAGSAFMLVGILWLYNLTGTFDLPAIQLTLQSAAFHLARRTEMLLFLSFFVAFAIKVPLFLFPEASHRAAPVVAVLAIIGIIYGALVALVQPNLKKLVAYSSVSHLGFVVLGIFTFHTISMQGAVYQMLAHGISTGALFFLVGMLYDRRHTFEISEYGGLATPMPKFAAFFLFVALSSMGLPMLNGFVGEYLILLGTYQVRWGWASWAATGVILSACYLLWAYQRVFYGEATNEKNRDLPDIDAREKWGLIVFAVIALWMGIGSPYFTRRVAAPVNAVIEQTKSRYAEEASKPAAMPQPAALASEAQPDSLRRAVSR